MQEQWGIRHRWLALTLGGGLFACDALGGKDEPVTAPDPDSFEFTVVFEITTPFDEPDHRPPETAELYRNGVRLGKAEDVYRLSKDEFLADAELTLRYDTTCGQEIIAATLHKTLEEEKAYRKWRIDEWVALKNGVDRETIHDWGSKPLQGLTIVTKEPLPKRTRKLSVDNRRGSEAKTMRLGTVEKTIAAGKFETLDLPVGHCEEALSVSIDGVDRGRLDWSKKKYKRAVKPTGIEAADPLGAHQTWLLDATADGCYRVTSKVYTSASDQYAYGAIEPETFKSSAKRSLHDIGPIFLYFEPFPISLEGEGGGTFSRLGDCDE